jgi:hypothetical protein
MPFSLADIPWSFIAIILSGLALLLNYRTSRRQGLAEDPLLILKRAPHRIGISVKNQGRSTAMKTGVKTKKGGFIRWSDQFNEALRKRDNMGGFEGGDKPWTFDCSGQTRTIAPGETVLLILADDIAQDEVLVVSFDTYAGKRIKHRFPLSEILEYPL